MGQGVVWYTGQFYALSFIQNTLNIDLTQASKLIMYALGFGTPFFLVFGGLSDKIGTKMDHADRDANSRFLVTALFIRPCIMPASIDKQAGNCTIKQLLRQPKLASANQRWGYFKNTTVTKNTQMEPFITETKKETILAMAGKLTAAKDVKITRSVVLDSRIFLDTGMACIYPGNICNDGLRSHCRISCRNVSGKNQVHFYVASVSYW